MNSLFFKSAAKAFMSFVLAIGLVGGMTAVANAQNMTASSTAQSPLGLTVSGWQQSSSIGQGYNTGGDGKGQVETMADGFFRLGAESFLTGNANRECTANCSDTQAKLWISGEQITGARATNQGIGNGVVSSVAGTNGMFNASLRTSWTFAPPPASSPTQP